MTKRLPQDDKMGFSNRFETSDDMKNIAKKELQPDGKK